ncbi:MAG: NAD(+)/NADH kinase [Spirochaetaceae bacterium]|jgi:NAD+ kinase|nr:NAD(+)/NADH kinase [Spirochaetaceae bacterium]
MGESKRVILFVNFHKTRAPVLARELLDELARLGIDAFSCPFEDAGIPGPEDHFDLAFSLGGDGTVLYTARKVAPLGIPIFPINIGTLGFIAAVHPDEWKTTFHAWLAGGAEVSRRLMLELWVERRGREVYRAVCLNDAVVSAMGIAKIIRLRAESTDGPPAEGLQEERISLGHYRSDGLIAATPTGSTGYSAAAGGPILDPELEAIIINPVCPFTQSNRPLVIPARRRVIVEVEAEQRSGVLLTVDGQLTEALEPGDRICIGRAPGEARLVASGRKGFYTALRTKFFRTGTAGDGDA